MTPQTTIDLSCPNGCYELEVSGHHATRENVEFLEGAITDGEAECPGCGATVGEVPDA